MTQEITLPPEKYGEIAEMMYLSDPPIKEIFPTIEQHVKRCHHLDPEEILDLEEIYSQIEHIDAVLKGRRTLEELA
jgi:hypothetical protein